jgi:ABC-2 type transport system ATP-binding protein
VIQARDLTKRYGHVVAVDGLSFEARPGLVTGFLGPNGAGKTTTMRLLLGLDAPTRGTGTIAGHPFASLVHPLREVGALLQPVAVHGGRSAAAHLRWLAASAAIPRQRVEQVLALVGLDGVARRRANGYSVGMMQRLGIAAALLGDPEVLLLDEPFNGLDPEGIAWVRTLMRELADDGRTVLLSSHLIGEIAQVADRVIVIARGRLVAEAGVEELLGGVSSPTVQVRSPRSEDLARYLRQAGAAVRHVDAQVIEVRGMGVDAVGELAAAHRVPLHELRATFMSLEEAFLRITAEAPGGSRHHA